MLGIGQFFKNIQSSFTKEVVLRSAIRDSLIRYIGTEVPIEKISCKNSIATIDGISQSARSVIFIKKNQILKEINANQTVRTITDIR